MKKNGDTTVLFSSACLKVNKRNKTQERQVVLTEKAIYNLIPKSFKCKRRIPLDQLTAISLSTLADNFIALHCIDYDYLLILFRKTEFVNLLLSHFSNLPKRFNVNLSDSFVYRADKSNLCERLFLNQLRQKMGQV
ncbi:hypothetical protein GEMRC1_008706 [Eukaryota sp. GEM-RC1]